MEPGATALIFNQTLSLPKNWRGVLEAGPPKIAITVKEPKVAILTPLDDTDLGAQATNEVSNDRVRLRQDQMAALGWAPGEVVEFIPAPDGMRVAAIDRRSHRDFVAPLHDEDGLPIPPAWMMQSFTSSANVAAGLRSGRQTAERVRDLAARYGSPLSAQTTLLDFGCGCGRVSRYVPLLTGSSVIGSDLHEDAIDWCEMHLPSGTFLHGTETPPLPLGPGVIDVVLAVSVLTHLDARHCGLWLAEWSRVLRPGGLALVTFHGDPFIDVVVPKGTGYEADIRRQWQAGEGAAFMDDKAWQGVFPDVYQTAYYSFEHVRREWRRNFEIVDLLPSGSFTNRQDLAVLRKRASS